MEQWLKSDGGTASLNRRIYHLVLRIISSLSLLLAGPLLAEPKVFELFLKDHLFMPSTLYVPSGEKVKLVIHNQDPTPEEFESFSLNREKVILGHSKGVVFIGPLPPGEHAFIGEYNPDTARGSIIVLSQAQWQLQQPVPPQSSLRFADRPTLVESPQSADCKTRLGSHLC